MTDEIQQRIDRLERDKRWWKNLALGFVTFVAILLVSGFIAGFIAQVRVRHERERAVIEAQRAAEQLLEKVKQ